jgi:hypothetical protein
MKWIFFKDQVPPFDTRILVCIATCDVCLNTGIKQCRHPTRTVYITEFSEGDKYITTGDVALTHWTKLPHPPKICINKGEILKSSRHKNLFLIDVGLLKDFHLKDEEIMDPYNKIMHSEVHNDCFYVEDSFALKVLKIRMSKEDYERVCSNLALLKNQTQ